MDVAGPGASPNSFIKIVPLRPTLDVYHDASGYMCVGEVLPGPTTVPQTLQPQPSSAKITLDSKGEQPIFGGSNYPRMYLCHWLPRKNPLVSSLIVIWN